MLITIHSSFEITFQNIEKMIGEVLSIFKNKSEEGQLGIKY